jgi:hypothetical protein
MKLNRRQEAAAFHGLATNKALPLLDRFQCALQALDLYEAELGLTDAVVVELPACEVCGFSNWPVGGMHAARSIHMRQHERGK